jgi:hypothetical protein
MLKSALVDLEMARTQSGPQVEAALESARKAMAQYLEDQQTPVKGTDSGGAVGHVPGTQGQGKDGGPGVLQIAPQDGASPRSGKRPPHSVRRARLETQLLRLRCRS